MPAVAVTSKLAPLDSHAVGLASAIAISLFATCLFWIPHSAFYYYDWSVHEWFVAYFRQYMLDNGSIPEVVNVESTAGVVNPLFYAGKFYALAGFLALPLGSGVGLRLVCFTALLLQCLHVYRTVFILNRSPILAASIAALCGLSIYQLTNLYNRGDVTEFVAFNLLICSISCLLNLIFAEPRSNYDRLGWGFYLAVACLTHPLTGCYGFALLIAPLLVVYLFASPLREGFLVVVGGASLVALALAPWLLLLITFPPHTTAIGQAFSDLIYYGGRDAVLVRFWPLPLDLGSIRHGVDHGEEITTPYLDAQLNAPVLILFVVLSGLRFRRPWRWDVPTLVWGGATLVFAATALVSVVPVIGESLVPTKPLQFAYRMVNFSNAALFIGVASVLTGMETKPLTHGNLLSYVLVACLTLALAGTLDKLMRAAAIIDAEPLAKKPLLTFYFPAFSMFDVRTGFRPLPKLPPGVREEMVAVPVSTTHFGETGVLSLTVPSASLIWTNIRPFPWNKMLLDGREVPNEQLYVRDASLGVLIDAGFHRIKYIFHPSQTWRLLNAISWITLGIWTLAMWLICAERCAAYFRKRSVVNTGRGARRG